MGWQKFIQTILKDFNLSPAELGELIDRSAKTIIDIQNGTTKNLRMKTIRGLENGLGIDIDYSNLNNITYSKKGEVELFRTSDDVDYINRINELEEEIKTLKAKLYDAEQENKKLVQIIPASERRVKKKTEKTIQ